MKQATCTTTHGFESNHLINILNWACVAAGNTHGSLSSHAIGCHSRCLALQRKQAGRPVAATMVSWAAADFRMTWRCHAANHLMSTTVFSHG
jgi:hypothetical protein